LNKKQRAAKAARAAKRLPIVGTAVVLDPLIEAAAETLNSGTITTWQGWANFVKRVRYKYLGVTDSGTIEGNRVAITWLPILGYIAAYKTGVAKYPSKILAKIGLRF